MMKNNYHTHTTRCHHAAGTDEQYVLAAIEGGFTEIGFSDHSCWSYDSAYKSHMRMTLTEFEGYYESILSLKEKYKDRINVLIGMECEYFPKYMGWLESFVKERKLDYIIFGNHFDTSDEIPGTYYGTTCGDDAVLKKYIDDCIAGMSTGLYSYLAHPDLFMRGRDVFDSVAAKESDRLCRWCKDNGAVLEFNLEGARMSEEKNVSWYPCMEFWEIAAAYGNDVIIGVDAHNPKSLRENPYYDASVEYLKKLKLNLITELPRKF